MTTAETIGVIIGALGLFSGFIMLFISRRFNSQDKRTEARRQESVLMMKWMMCASDALREMAEAIRTQRCNGELSTAVASVADCGQALNTYLIEQNAQINH